jgi:hypothetical protein
MQRTRQGCLVIPAAPLLQEPRPHQHALDLRALSSVLRIMEPEIS